MPRREHTDNERDSKPTLERARERKAYKLEWMARARAKRKIDRLLVKLDAAWREYIRLMDEDKGAGRKRP